MDKEKIRSSNLFPVVGIGASAGGMDAFKRLLKAIPEDSGMAYILVQHLDPVHESILATLLQKSTNIPISEITDNIHVEADHIYIIPSNKLLTATDGILQLSPRPHKSQKNMTIDLFFSSLAEVHQQQAIGVILSGTGTDGTLGLKAIKDRGGTTFAQEPPSAAYDDMPQSVINAGLADYILPPEKIPGQLSKLFHQLKEFPDDKVAIPHHEDGFHQIINLLYTRTGVDFAYYKQTTIRRRISRRITLSNAGSTAIYLSILKENTAELEMLYQDLLISVTQFFRDPAVFAALSTTVFPALLKDKAKEEPLRIWVAGCSTGEEVYSIVMCLYEYLGDKLLTTKLQVFATDISGVAITKARAGIYSKRALADVSDSRQQAFFTKTNNKMRLSKVIRDACVFASHNYLKDPPFAKMDLICCRNSLIYMEPALQNKALATFHYALKEKGYLILGKSETTGASSDLYNTIDKNCRIYSRKAVPGKFKYQVPDLKGGTFRTENAATEKTTSRKADFQQNADEIILSQYAPPGVIVNNELEIVQFRGATGIWLESSPGKPDLHVLKMLREELSFEVRNAIHKVKSSKEALIKSDIPFRFMDQEYLATIEVVPLLNTADLHFLILFRDTSPVAADSSTLATGHEPVADDARQNKARLRIMSLQKELALARKDMRNITEAQQASNEALQSANEELLSGSEELQSLNEELETSKEEIQTSNEELIIVNQELSDRNEQLNLSRLYAESIVTTIREPLLILNKDLVVKSANRSFYQKFQATEEGTEGQLLFNLGNKQWNIPALRRLLEKLLPEKANVTDFEVAHSFPGLGERIMLLNASRIYRDNNEEQLILLAIEDITVKRKIEEELKLFAGELEKQVSERTSSLHEANINLVHLNENLQQFAYIASHDLQEPLRKIRTFSAILQERYITALPEAGQVLIRKIISSSERMSTLIKEVLNFSQILHKDTAFEQTNLNNILAQVINDFDLLITEKEAVIHFEDLPVIEAIPLQISQLFYNLLSNSLKFSKENTAPVITITSTLLKKKQLKKYPSLNPHLSYYLITFKDNGIGFDQQFADQIFLIFHRLKTREEYTGTGIGLALCKKIVINHQGEIYGISTEHGGALFEILLPVQQDLEHNS